MKPAISTSFDYDLPFEAVITMVSEAGFESVMLGAKAEHSGYATAEGRKEIRRLSESHGVAVGSIHAPSPEGDRLFSLDDSERELSLRQCKAAFDAAAELGAKVVMIHLIQPYDIPHDEKRDRMVGHGRRSVGVLADYALKRGVGLALENGQRADYDAVLEAPLGEFDAPHVGLCYDTGHENVQGRCFDLLEKHGGRLLAVHVHDNAGKDTHVLPGEGTIDWEQFRRTLHGLGFSDDLLLELQTKHSRFRDHAAFLAEAKRRAEELCLAAGGG